MTSTAQPGDLQQRGLAGKLRRAATGMTWLVAEGLHRRRPWWKWPRWPGLFILVAFRGRLRAENLYDTNDLPATEPVRLEKAPTDRDLVVRSPDGSLNDRQRPTAGMADTRFGRNVPLCPYGPKYKDLHPAPRLVSDKLMARTEFVPFPKGNALLAAWIQFMVRDWFNHGEGDDDLRFTLCQPCTSAPVDSEPLELARIKRDRTGPLMDQPPTHVNVLTHWWDASSIYPSKEHHRDRVRTDDNEEQLPNGRIRDDLYAFLPEPAQPNLPPAEVPGFWAGLAVMMSLFAKEHNAICEELHRRYPLMGPDELYEKARLINAALIAKIHTLDWTASVLGHKTTVWGTEIEWWGLLGEKVFRRFGRISRYELLRGIPGSPTKDFGVPFSITEEFAAVYRMHAMLPDLVSLYRADQSAPDATCRLEDLLGKSVHELDGDYTEADLIHSLARTQAGLVTLHNFPAALRRMRHRNQPTEKVELDLAAADILRCRELGVPRYNDLRRALHMKPAKNIAAITSNPQWCKELNEVYGGDVEAVDLLVGLHAEDLPPGFAFGDTAFRIFLLMAPRRLLSDRFFTADYRADIYTSAGIEWVEKYRLTDVITRHYPVLEPWLDGVDNAFHPWHRTGGGRA